MDTLNPGVFVISLDAIDLNLLPTIYNARSDTIAPLWTKSNLERRNNEYYEFEIKTKQPEENTKDQSKKLRHENTICSICNIDVPKLFMNEHKKSSRHKCNVQIADIAINRMKSHLNNPDKECDESDIDPSLYFCQTCVTIIDSGEKINHESSNMHRNALVVDKIFIDFLVLYHYSEEKVEESTNDTDPRTGDGKKKTVVVNEEIKDNPSDKFVKALEKPIEMIHKNVIKKETDSLKDKVILDVKEYIAVLNKRCEKILMFFKALNENFIEIETIDGSTVIVNEQNFHGFNKIGRKHYHCYVCKKNYKQKNIEEHKISEMHINNMILPLKNKHCIRQIGENQFHCVICNLLIQNSDFHLLCDKIHAVKLKDALVSDKLDENNLQKEKDLLKQANAVPYKDINLKMTKETMKSDKVINQKDTILVYNENNNNEAIKNINVQDKILTENNDKTEDSTLKETTKALYTYFCQTCNSYNSILRCSEHKNSPKHIFNLKSDFHYLMKEADQDLLCRICDISVNDNEEDVRKHIEVDKHIIQYNNLMLHNGIEKLSDECFYCKRCKENILVKNEIIHINEKRHIMFKCGDSLSDKELIDDKEQSGDASDTIPIEHYNCEVCNVKLPNNEHNIQEHVKGRNHSKNFNKRSDDLKTITKDIDCTKKRIIPHYHMETTEYPHLLRCRVCKIFVTYHELTMSQHVKNSNHIYNYMQCLKKNFVVKKFDRIYCDLCAVEVGVNNELMHINGKRHNTNIDTRKVELVNGTVSKSTSTVSPSVEEGSLHSTSKSNSVIHDKAQSKVETDKKSFEYYNCMVCNVKVPNSESNIKEHLNGKNHAQNLEKKHDNSKNHDKDIDSKSGDFKIVTDSLNTLTTDELINDHYHMDRTECSDLLRCKICKVAVYNINIMILRHLTNLNHIMNYEKFLKKNFIITKLDSTYCELCAVTITAKSEFIHINSKKHNNNVEKRKVESVNVLLLKSNSVDNASRVEDRVPSTSKSNSVMNDKEESDEICVNTIQVMCNVEEPYIDEEHFKLTNNVQNVNKNSNDSEDHTKDMDSLVTHLQEKSTTEGPINLHYHMEMTENQELILCKICKVTVVYNEFAMSQHLTSLNHIANYEMFLKRNFIIQTLNNIHCELCSVTVGTKSEFIHIDGKKHKKNIVCKFPTAIVSECVTAIASANVKDSVPSASNCNSVLTSGNNIEPEMLELLEATKNSKEVICKICKVIVPFTEYSVRTHIQGGRHVLAHRALLAGDAKQT